MNSRTHRASLTNLLRRQWKTFTTMGGKIFNKLKRKSTQEEETQALIDDNNNIMVEGGRLHFPTYNPIDFNYPEGNKHSLNNSTKDQSTQIYDVDLDENTKKNYINFCDVTQKQHIPNITLNYHLSIELYKEYGLPTEKGKLLEKTMFDICYDDVAGQALWVRECFDRESLKLEGEMPKRSPFPRSVRGPYQCFKNKDHYKEDYTKGHLAAHGNYTTEKARRETNDMANLSPMARKLNEGLWNWVEQYCRDLVLEKGYYRILMYTGPLCRLLDLSTYTREDIANAIGAGRVPVPTHFFKVILAIKENGEEYVGVVVVKNTDKNEKIASSIPTDKSEKITSSIPLTQFTDEGEKITSSIPLTQFTDEGEKIKSSIPLTQFTDEGEKITITSSIPLKEFEQKIKINFFSPYISHRFKDLFKEEPHLPKKKYKK